jgi:sterol desaturase/sphingolipid hydroxylase (fatty acid hydroxylase superfamily)
MCNPQTLNSAATLTARRPSLRAKQQKIQSTLLDSATSLFVGHYLYNNPSYLNPWNIPNAPLWIAGFIVIRCAIAFYDHLVVAIIEKAFKCKVLPTREPGAPPVRYVSLDSRSIIYLSINALNEYAFVMRLTHYLWHGGYQNIVPWKIEEISLTNTIIALGIMFVFMDLLYAPLHHILHLPRIYPLIHKHHHRQHYPVRGYLDAGNEHPIEHMIGVVCTWFAVLTAELLLPSCHLWLRNGGNNAANSTDSLLKGGGVHAITVLIFFNLHAALAMLNHSPYNVNFSMPFIGSTNLFRKENRLIKLIERIPLVGKRSGRIITGQWFVYSVGHHEMHHRKFNFNYGQYCMFYDLFMGTFVDYEGPKSASQIAAERDKLKDG